MKKSSILAQQSQISDSSSVNIRSHLKLYGQGRRGFFQEKLIEAVFNRGHNGSYKEIMVQIIDFCDPNNEEKREGFWMHK